MSNLDGMNAFGRLASALEPWLDQVVVVGGWAHRLYRLHPFAQSLDYAPLLTLDTDIAIPARLPVTGQDIRQRLLAEGFYEEFAGDEKPPATHYHLRHASSGFYAEFLTPLIGGGYDRRNKRRATTQIAGINSQQLRYIELLLDCPWTVNLDSPEFAGTVRIANPVSFLAQKVLIHTQRNREDRAKDILYIHDTLEVFGSRLIDLQMEWRTKVRPQFHQPHLTVFLRTASRLFGAVSDDFRRAARVSPERSLVPASLLEACRYGFHRVFSPPEPPPTHRRKSAPPPS